MNEPDKLKPASRGKRFRALHGADDWCFGRRVIDHCNHPSLRCSSATFIQRLRFDGSSRYDPSDPNCHDVWGVGALVCER